MVGLDSAASISHVKGHLDRLDDGLLTGWFANSDDTMLDEPVTIWSGDRVVALVERCDYREDLAQAGIAAGRAAFSADVSLALDGSGVPLELSLSTGPENAPQVFLRQTVSLADHRPLNPNPFVTPQDRHGIAEWTIAHDPVIGLRIDDFPLPRELAQFASRYTRLAFTDRHTVDGQVRLTCPVSVDRALDGDLSVVLLVRADRRTTLSCSLSTNGKSVAGLELEANATWSLLTRPLVGSTARDVEPGSRCEFTLSAAHRGRGFLDIALCCVAREPSLRYLNRVHRGLSAHDAHDEEAAQPISYVRNGDFESWSHGIRFNELRSGQQLADGWFLEGRKSDMRSVAVSIDSAERRSLHGDTGAAPHFGLRVRTSEFDGVMRLVSSVDRRALDETGLTLRLSLHALGQSKLAQLRRISLIVRGNGHESIGRVLAGKTRIRAKSIVDIVVDEGGLVALRRACADHPELLLALEFEQSSDVFVESIELIADKAVNPPDDIAACDDEEGFEDSNVALQLPFIKGLEGWQNGADCIDSTLVRAEEPIGVDAFEYVVPDIQRPWAGYPSVDIVVPVYNALESVKACVRSVVEQTTVPYTLILIDDGSEQDTHDWLRRAASRFPNIVLVTNAENRGYTKTVNRGLKMSKADYVCVLNSDCIVTPEWLALMVDCASQQENAGMVGPLSNAASYQSVPKIRDDNGAWCFNPLPDVVSPASMAARVREHSVAGWPKVRVLNGFCQLIDRSAIESIGFLDEEAFPRGFGEENDFCARLVEAGFTLHVVDDAYVFHSKSQSFGHEQRKTLSKEGSAALKRKHPTLDWGEITREVEFAAPITQLRDRLAA